MGARVWRAASGLDTGVSELCAEGGRLVAGVGPAAPVLDVGGRIALPGLVNGHDHLDFASLPALGRPPYGNLYDWADDVRAGAGHPDAAAAGLAVPFLDRLWLGGLRNLLCGVTTVAHHGSWRRSFLRPVFALATRLRHGFWPGTGFPVRVLRRYGWAHSPGLESDLRRARRRTPRGAPFMIHAAEGVDARAAGEVSELARLGLLDAQARLVHAIAASPEDVARIATAGAGVIWCPESNLHLYGRTTDVRALAEAGVPLGLGSDSPASGGRDLLTTLARAREQGAPDEWLLRLATRDTAELLGAGPARLQAGAPADLLVVESLDGLVRGERSALALVVLAGRPLLGTPEFLRAFRAPAVPLEVDGRRLAIVRGYARLLALLLERHPALSELAWLGRVRLLEAA